jgi:hypothetical protein
MEADLEEQHQNAKFGECVNYRIVWIDDSEHGGAEEHSSDELSDHCGLVDLLRQEAEQLGCDKQHEEGEQEVRE